MTEDNSYLVPCREAYVREADGPFQRGSLWAEPEIDAAAAFVTGGRLLRSRSRSAAEVRRKGAGGRDPKTER